MSEVLALEYRPKTFEEVIGQEITIKQIQSALENNTLGHALLFSGPRGTGKTTTARIIANCLNSELAENERALSISELDAASNNSVDHIRELSENIKYSTRGHRVVILDEAHMLTRNAWNAFLKTLEEPPPQVSFILVTTEFHKIPATIKSRCQLYEFREVDFGVIAQYLGDIVRDKEIDLDPKQILGVALKADGSVRDGLSLLQKFLSCEAAEDLSDSYFSLVSAVYSQDTTTALALVGEIRKSEEPRVIIQTLEKWFYWASLEAFGMKTPIRDKLPAGATDAFDLSHLQRLFEGCLAIERNFMATPNSKSVLDMGIISLCL
jgi:DNA polymerase III subunit gamma/tau